MMKDREVADLIKRESIRQKKTLQLIASENRVSKDVLEALGSVFTNKYAEGYPGGRYYQGNAGSDDIETLAIERALKAFRLSPRAWHVNVQPHSGTPANLAVYVAFLEPGARIMGLELAHGGHLSHGHNVSFTGKFWKQIPYGVDRKKEILDYDDLMEKAKQEKPAMIVAGFTAYPRKINFKKFREIADAVGAHLHVDMSHVAGLVAGGAYPSPFPYADTVMATTHKTLRGPRGALIFCKPAGAKRVDKAVFPGLQGGPHMNAIAGIAVALGEALEPSFKEYAKQTVQNATVLARELKRLGFRLVSGGTDSHLILIDTWNGGAGIPGDEAAVRLEAEGIVVNKNTIPFETRTPLSPSGIRVGVAWMTTDGAKEDAMVAVAERIAHCILSSSKA